MGGEYFHEWALLTARNLHSSSSSLNRHKSRNPGNGPDGEVSLCCVVEVWERGDLTAATLT